MGASHGKLAQTILRRLIAGVLLFNVLVGGITVFSSWQSLRQYQDRASINARNLSKTIAQNITDLIAHVDYGLANTSVEVSRQLKDGGISPSDLNLFLTQQKSHQPFVEAIRITNAKGDVVFGSGSFDVKSAPFNALDRDYFLLQREAKGDELVISDTHISRISGQWSLFFSRRLSTPNGGFFGVVYGVVPLEAISKFFSQVDIGPSGGISLRAQDMSIIARFPDPAGAFRGNNKTSPELQAFLSRGETSGTYYSGTTWDGTARTVSFQKIGDYPLYVNIGLASADYLVPWRIEMRRMAGLYLGVVLISVLWAFNFYRNWLTRVQADQDAKDQHERQLHETVAEKTEKLRLVLDSAGEAIYGVDTDGVCTFANPACRRLLGYDRESDLIGKVMHQVMHHSHPDASPFPMEDCEIHSAVVRGRPIPAGMELFWHSDGTSFPAEYWAYPMFIGDQVVGAVVTFIDITERKAAEESLRAAKLAAEESSRAKSRFLAMMSHEIRTPLNGVVGNADILAEAGLSSEQGEYVKTIRASARALLAVVDDILDLSKLDAGRVEAEHVPFILRQVMSDISLILQPSATDRGIAFVVEVEETLPEVLLGDAVRLRQVLLNLGSNAIKFTAKGGVTMRTAQDGPGRVLFEVKDTGIGISAEGIQRLFAEFSQVDNSIARRYGGTGLGLSISRRLVKLMGGDILVESQEGTGSCFHFTLPLEITDQAVAFQAAPILPDLAKLDVLLAEDNPVNAKVMESFLRREGHRVTVAINGQAALTAASEQRFDVILMDMQMPVMDGLEATRLIRALPGVQALVPILGVTANAFVEDKTLCLDAGMNGYLSKPVSRNDLFAAIARLVVPAA